MMGSSALCCLLAVSAHAQCAYTCPVGETCVSDICVQGDSGSGPSLRTLEIIFAVLFAIGIIGRVMGYEPPLSRCLCPKKKKNAGDAGLNMPSGAAYMAMPSQNPVVPAPAASLARPAAHFCGNCAAPSTGTAFCSNCGAQS